MECTYRPKLGQVVLVEGVIADPDPVPVSGVVAGVIEGGLIVELSCSSPTPAEGTRVVSSHFAPEALYRMTATVRAEQPGYIRLEDCDLLETVQRRRWPRRAVSIPVTLVAPDMPSPSGVKGETVDIGIGGALVRTHDRLPDGADPLVAITPPGAETMLIVSRVVGSEVAADHVDYRLAFCELDDIETARLADIVRHAPVTAGAPC